MQSFLTNVPIWVWPLLIGLLTVSLRATRSRTAPLLLVYCLPLLGLLSLRTILSLNALTIAIACFTIAYALGAWIGHAKQARYITAKSSRSVTVKGEWMTLITVMGLFSLNFIHGAVNGMAPEATTTALYAAALSGIAGLISGTFIGRAIRTARTPINQRAVSANGNPRMR